MPVREQKEIVVEAAAVGGDGVRRTPQRDLQVQPLGSTWQVADMGRQQRQIGHTRTLLRFPETSGQRAFHIPAIPPRFERRSNDLGRKPSVVANRRNRMRAAVRAYQSVMTGLQKFESPARRPGLRGGKGAGRP
jgi:hypothetical protein